MRVRGVRERVDRKREGGERGVRVRRVREMVERKSEGEEEEGCD